MLLNVQTAVKTHEWKKDQNTGHSCCVAHIACEPATICMSESESAFGMYFPTAAVFTLHTSPNKNLETNEVYAPKTTTNPVWVSVVSNLSRTQQSAPTLSCYQPDMARNPGPLGVFVHLEFWGFLFLINPMFIQIPVTLFPLLK